MTPQKYTRSRHISVKEAGFCHFQKKKMSHQGHFLWSWLEEDWSMVNVLSPPYRRCEKARTLSPHRTSSVANFACSFAMSINLGHLCELSHLCDCWVTSCRQSATAAELKQSSTHPGPRIFKDHLFLQNARGILSKRKKKTNMILSATFACIESIWAMDWPSLSMAFCRRCRRFRSQ